MRLLAAQAWPAEFVQWLEQQAANESEPSPLPLLRTWLVAQGQTHTPEGERGFTLTLRLPQSWNPGAASASANAAPPEGTAKPSNANNPGAPSAGLAASFAGTPRSLNSGLFALVLQPTQQAQAARTSALLSLEFAPWLGNAAAASNLYGRDSWQRSDPWLQWAALQAGSSWRDVVQGEHNKRLLCDQPGCPYEGRAPCEQPFCLALRVSHMRKTSPG